MGTYNRSSPQSCTYTVRTLLEVETQDDAEAIARAWVAQHPDGEASVYKKWRRSWGGGGFARVLHIGGPRR